MPSVPPPGRALRLLLADDDKLFAESLMTVLSEDDRLEVVGIAADGAQAVELAVRLQPDVLLMDLNMPVMDGLEATRRIRKAGLPVQILLLTGADTEIAASEATDAGASAFLRKERGAEEIRHVLLEVASLAAALGSRNP